VPQFEIAVHLRRLSPAMAKRLRCYLGFHRWQVLRVKNGDGHYKECRDCRKFKDMTDRAPPSL